MSSTKRPTRFRTCLLRFIICGLVGGFLFWWNHERLYPPTDVCAIERNEPGILIDLSQAYPIQNNLELIGHAGGYATSVFVQGDIAFVKMGLELAAFDVRDPAHPVRIGYILIPGELIHVDDKRHYAYILYSEVEVPPRWEFMRIDTVDPVSGLWKVDISNPAQMSAIHVYKRSDNNYIENVRIVDERAYVTTRRCEFKYRWSMPIRTRCDDTLRIVDTTNPALPAKCYRWLFDRVFRSFAAWGAPKLTTAPTTAKQGNYRYAAEGKDGFKIYDVTSSRHPVEISSYFPKSEFTNIAVYKGQALVTSQECENQEGKSCLRALDLTIPAEPKDLGELPYEPVILTEFGRYVVVRDGWDSHNDRWFPGVEILDRSLPNSEAVISTSEQTADIVNMAVVGERAYATTEDNRFLILDISDIKNPMTITSYRLGEDDQTNCGVSIAGSYAYISAWNAGVRVLDISDESNVVDVTVYGADCTPSSVVVKGHYAYISNDRHLEVVDITDPLLPTQIAIYDSQPPDGLVRGFHILNNYLFMTAYDSGLQVLDISDPASPSLVGSSNIDDLVTGVDIDCQHIYLSSSENGVFILKADWLPTENCD